jgi:RNA polymerase sigma-70 factor (ECF subfamily)
MPLTDAAIVRRVLTGDTEAFGGLVERHYDRCVRLALHIVGNREDAEDAVQDTFLRAYRYLSGYQERERFAAWLYRILVNQCRSALARRRRVEAPLPDWERAPVDVDAEQPVEREAMREELARALALLPPEQREAVVLKFGEDLTYDEMAAITGTGISALKMRVKRACERLRSLLLEGTHV